MWQASPIIDAKVLPLNDTSQYTVGLCPANTTNTYTGDWEVLKSLINGWTFLDLL